MVTARPLVEMEKSVTVQIGSNYDLQCTAKGFPIATVEWFVDGQPFVPNKFDSRVYILGGCTIYLLYILGGSTIYFCIHSRRVHHLFMYTF